MDLVPNFFFDSRLPMRRLEFFAKINGSNSLSCPNVRGKNNLVFAAQRCILSPLDRAYSIMISANARQEFLETIPIFAGLNAQAVSEIAAAVEEAEFRAGEIIVRENEPGNRMFIMHTGRVEVVKQLAKPRETVLAVFGPKDFLGEMSIIECVARAASLRAIEDTLLFALKGTDLYHLFKHQPDQYAIVILNIARDLSRRLRAIDEMFTAVSH
jgi:CRP/FNR family transcriptional regulator, cyclic AMP receptor protein